MAMYGYIGLCIALCTAMYGYAGYERLCRAV